MSTVAEVMKKAPNWLIKDANLFGTTIPLRSPDYAALVGIDFIDFFSKIENREGKVDGWEWHVRKVDELLNLTIWRA